MAGRLERDGNLNATKLRRTVQQLWLRVRHPLQIGSGFRLNERVSCTQTPRPAWKELRRGLIKGEKKSGVLIAGKRQSNAKDSAAGVERFSRGKTIKRWKTWLNPNTELKKWELDGHHGGNS